MTTPQKIPRKRRRWLLLLVCLFTPVAALSGWLLYLHQAFQKAVPVDYASKGPNAVWAGHSWVGYPKLASDYDRLGDLLKRNHITDAFVHVGPLDGDGTIPSARYPYATDLLAAMKERFPNVRVQAWMGQVEKRGGGPLDLSDTATRATIVRTAAKMLDLGFDGIHYNIEPLASGDSNLLELLDKSAELTRSHNKILSMATDELEPLPGVAWLIGQFALRGGYWSAAYYTEVANRVDQVAAMTYDTTLPRDWLYGNFVAWQSRNLARLIGDKATLFIGVPTYEDRRLSFRPEAENIRSAFRGLGMAFSQSKSAPAENFGVAIYSLWTTNEDEWNVYRRDWLGDRATSALGKSQ